MVCECMGKDAKQNFALVISEMEVRPTGILPSTRSKEGMKA